MDTWQALTDEIVACRACPRLVAWREQVAREKRRAYQEWDYWGRQVPGFGDPSARLLIVGLAPGAHGSNRTGRMFTGDSSGDTLYAALYRARFANQPTARHAADGLRLSDAFVTALVRCVPPRNRPAAEEVAACSPFLVREWELLTRAHVLLALGQMAFDGCLRLLGHVNHQLVPRARFRHGLHVVLPSPLPSKSKHLLASYHPSRQNTQTGRLTPDMLDEIFAQARALLES